MVEYQTHRGEVTCPRSAEEHQLMSFSLSNSLRSMSEAQYKEYGYSMSGNCWLNNGKKKKKQFFNCCWLHSISDSQFNGFVHSPELFSLLSHFTTWS